MDPFRRPLEERALEERALEERRPHHVVRDALEVAAIGGVGYELYEHHEKKKEERLERRELQDWEREQGRERERAEFDQGGGSYGGPGSAYGAGAYPQEGSGYGYSERQAGLAPYESGAMPPLEGRAYGQPYSAPPPGQEAYGRPGNNQPGYGGYEGGSGRREY